MTGGFDQSPYTGPAPAAKDDVSAILDRLGSNVGTPFGVGDATSDLPGL